MHRVHRKIGLYTLLALGAGGVAPAYAPGRKPADMPVTTPLTSNPELGMDPTVALGRHAPGRRHPGLRPALAQRGRMALRLPRPHHRAARDRHRRPRDAAARSVRHHAAHAARRPRRSRDLLPHRRRADDVRAAQLLGRDQHRPGEHEHPGAPGERVDVVPGAGVAAGRQRSVRQRAAEAGALAHRRPDRRVREPLRLARRIRRGPLRHAADRARQRHRRTHQRPPGVRRTGC